MNLTRRPIPEKTPKPVRNPVYLAKVRELPCCICAAFGEKQITPTTAHHPIHGRYSQRRVADEMAIGLCDGHHQGNFDGTKIAIHREPEEWRRRYGNDFDYIAITQDQILGA